jgi:hypothetical protein
MIPSLAALDEIVRTAPKGSRLGRISRDKGVRASEEFRRIDALPRRVWTPEASEALVQEMTAVLKQPTGTKVLKPNQAIALLELGMYAGGLCPLRAGAGKSLVTFLAPYVMGAERPVLLVPAKLREKTKKEIVAWSEHFRVAYWLIIKSYEEISRVSHARFLEELGCDLLLCDEGHKLKNPKAAVTKRVRRHVEHSDCRVVVLSGTITKRKVSDYAHLSKWSLDEGSPVPRSFGDVLEWGDALDENPRAMFRTSPGALTLWSRGDDTLDAVRRGYQGRVTQTPGVIASYDQLTDCSLVISREEIPHCPQIAAAFQKLRDDAETPDGWRLIDGLQIAATAKQLALGFYYRWEPRGPEPWMQARAEWGKFVRYVLANNRSGIDSELQVAQVCAKNEIDFAKVARKLESLSEDPYRTWREIRDSFKPNSVPVWISNVALRSAMQWLQQGPGIVWCDHVAFAEMLSEATGVPYAGQGGLTQDGTPIEALEGKPVIASGASSGEGRNLQAWSRNLITSPPSLGAEWEQRMARTHRDGQAEDEVTVDVLIGCLENELSFAQARKDAQYIAHTTGQEQRLGYATILWDARTSGGPVWEKVKEQTNGNL